MSIVKEQGRREHMKGMKMQYSQSDNFHPVTNKTQYDPRYSAPIYPTAPNKNEKSLNSKELIQLYKNSTIHHLQIS